jgi:hypothetical protein
MSSFACPHCGAEVPDKALCCPECGSDKETGWNENSEVTGDPVVDEVDYEEAAEQEFGPPAGQRKNRVSGKFWVAVILLLLIGYGLLRILAP